MVDNRRTVPLAAARVLCVLEVEVPRQEPKEWVRVVCSIPGREGAFSRTWPLSRGAIASPTWQDLEGFVLSALQNAADTIGGVQLTL